MKRDKTEIGNRSTFNLSELCITAEKVSQDKSNIFRIFREALTAILIHPALAPLEPESEIQRHGLP
jgi:hypothetical protein